jgi:hypothetical protein
MIWIIFFTDGLQKKNRYLDGNTCRAKSIRQTVDDFIFTIAVFL